MDIKEQYKKIILPKLKEKFGFENDFEAPRLAKVVINVGFGKNTKEKNYADNIVKTLSRITGQKPVLTKAKKSISAFKIREGMVIGAAVTLRGRRMYDFIQKLIHVTFPRVRDFRGIKKSVIDSTGNMTVGFKENIAFPEIKAEDIESVHGLEISVSTTAKNKEEGEELFKLLGFPFKED
jgi:large subunit ribosomal protein L5